MRWPSPDSILGSNCPLCGRELDGPGVCSSCAREMHAARRHNLLYLGNYRKYKDVVRSLKYRGGRNLVPILARKLAEGVRAAEWRPEAVTAVPTMWWRSWLRGYNPAEVLAREIAAELELPYQRVLARRYAPSQTRRGRDERSAVKAGVFYLRMILKQQTWLLVDDVWTTGGTFRAVERVLRAGGARAVFGAVIAARGG